MDEEPKLEATTPIYDISGSEPVLGDIPHSQVQDAIASGKFSFPKGHEVAVISPDGIHGTLPADRAPSAFQNGYLYATPEMVASQADIEKYGTRKQQAMTAIEGVAQGIAGPLAPAAERALGINPEDIRKRAEINPWWHGGAEAAGFGAGLFTGASEAALVGKAGEAAAAALKLGGEGAGIASRIAAGGAKAATEMAMIQAGDEATKAITQDPNQSVGSAAINVGLSGLLGGVGGSALTGAGMAVGAGIKAAGLDTALKEFTDRIAYRGANLHPNEAIQNEVSEAVNAYHQMGSEVGGANGMKAQALAKIMPEMSPKIMDQARSLEVRAQQEIEKLGDDPLAKQMKRSLEEYSHALENGTAPLPPVEMPQRVSPDFSGIPDTVLKARRPTPERLAQISEASARADAENLSRLNASGFDMYGTGPKTAPASSSDVFDAMQRFKQQLHEWGEFNKLGLPPISDRAFIKSARSLGHDFKSALEDPSTWGRVAELQTKLNSAWHDAIPTVKDIESKFMTKISGRYEIDPAKFNTYSNLNAKATETFRQKMVRNFTDAMEKFHDATALVYERAGIPNPHSPIGLTALKESLEKKSPWAKMADLYYDRALSNAAGTAVGAGVGGAAGHATGIPGAGMVLSMLGGKLGEKVLPSIIQPLMTKSMNSGALQQAVKFAENVIRGDSQLMKSAKNVFIAGETIPQHLFPVEAKRDKLNKSLEYAQADPSRMFNIGGDLGHYMPDHQTALATHAQTAVNYLNSLRPDNPKIGPLDTKIPPSKAQIAAFDRQLDIAEQPLLVFEHIKHGTLLPQDMTTLRTIYPALYAKMSQQLMTSMTDHLSKGEVVPYRLRQSLSQFLGEPLDSTMSPASIVAIQGTFQTQGAGADGPQPAQGKRSTSKLGQVATSAQTPSQAREAHRLKA